LDNIYQTITKFPIPVFETPCSNLKQLIDLLNYRDLCERSV